MSDIKEFTKGSKNPINILDTISYNLLFARDNPDYFYPAGIWCFCGPQGSGKTLSAVQCLEKICKAYPKAKVVTNVKLNIEIENEVIEWVSYEQLTSLSNGVEGIIFFLDELHVIWNSLESKDIPISEMACFCQMRKDRRVIIGTAQVYGRIAKPIREQLQYVIDCKKYFNVLQVNTILDPSDCIEKNGNLEAKIICHKWWFHHPRLYKMYDTLFKINRTTRTNKKSGRP